MVVIVTNILGAQVAAVTLESGAERETVATVTTAITIVIMPLQVATEEVVTEVPITGTETVGGTTVGGTEIGTGTTEVGITVVEIGTEIGTEIETEIIETVGGTGIGIIEGKEGAVLRCCAVCCCAVLRCGVAVLCSATHTVRIIFITGEGWYST